MTFCPFKKDKCGDTAEVEFEDNVNSTQSLTVNDMSEGETCSFKIKSKCNSPGFKKVSSEGMDDGNTEVSFIEYKKSMVNATEKDGDSETMDSRKTKMPSDDKPPRNNSYSDMGKMNKTSCKYNYSASETDKDTIVADMEGKAKVNATLESNGTYTVEICFKKQSKPKRKFKNGTYTETEDMEDASKEHWEEYSKENGDGPPKKDSSFYVTDSGVHTVGKEGKGPRRKTDSDGWDGKTMDDSKTDWGKSYNDTQYQSDSDASESESGYGKPSKGTYSSEMGGYKSFGTEGQGDSSVGAKDTNDTTCGDRIVLLSVRALNDTSDNAGSSDSSSSGVHPIVKATSSHMTFEVGSYAFYDDLEIYASEESATVLKTSWMLISIASLFVMSFTNTL